MNLFFVTVVSFQDSVSFIITLRYLLRVSGCEEYVLGGYRIWLSGGHYISRDGTPFVMHPMWTVYLGLAEGLSHQYCRMLSCR